MAALTGSLGLGNVASSSWSEICGRSSPGFSQRITGKYWHGAARQCFVKLVRLGQQPGFEELVRRLRLIPRSDYPQNDRRYTGIFDIANAEALGKTEVEVINVMIRGVALLIALEKRLENGEVLDLDEECRTYP